MMTPQHGGSTHQVTDGIVQRFSGLPWIHNDGGRAAAGYQGTTRDCVVRAISIGAELPYQYVYDKLNELAKDERPRKRERRRSNARLGTFRRTYEKLIIDELGWEWTPTMRVGQGCTVHMRPGELPNGRLILSVSRHLCCVIDGVVHDLFNPSRGGTRCVYGYYRRPPAAKVRVKLRQAACEVLSLDDSGMMSELGIALIESRKTFDVFEMTVDRAKKLAVAFDDRTLGGWDQPSWYVRTSRIAAKTIRQAIAATGVTPSR